MRNLILFFCVLCLSYCTNNDELITPLDIWSFTTESNEKSIDIPSGTTQLSLQIDSEDLCAAYGIEVILEKNNTVLSNDIVTEFPNEIVWNIGSNENHKLTCRSIIMDPMTNCFLFGQVDFILLP